ncbi:MAG TPA: hypothetical protein VI932_11175, partial [Bacteroidota bacterium]|nr:hypothetical protein [Bacteroidota bacterium]
MSNRFRSFQLFILILTLAALAPAQWSTDPAINTPVCTAVNGQYYPEIYTPGTGGSILVWHDFRPGLQADLYVQKFDTGGTPQWTPNGVALSMAAGHQWGQTITGDGLGGAIVAWHDERNNSDYFD